MILNSICERFENNQCFIFAMISKLNLFFVQFDYELSRPQHNCIYCGKKMIPGKMWVHLKYQCGPDAVRTAKQACHVTLKIAYLVWYVLKYQVPGLPGTKNSNVGGKTFYVLPVRLTTR